MKKLLLLATLCFALPAQALDKRDLETAIRSLDIESVKQIIQNEKLSFQEYNQYLDLAEEVVRNREQWIMKTFNHNDVTTPYKGPSATRLSLELSSVWLCPKLITYCYHLIPIVVELPRSSNAEDIQKAITAIDVLKQKLSQRETLLKITALAIGASLAIKFLYDLRKRFVLDNEHEKLLRKKYDDAVTIKQLIYGAHILEA